MAPDVKNLLKAAKQAIKDKNYEDAAKHCEAVLKQDCSNYQALVILGRALQELEKYDDSKKALQLAASTNPDCSVAWQGLATLSDLNPQLITPSETVTLYSKLLSFPELASKQLVFLRKLSLAQQSTGNVMEAVETLKTLHLLAKEESVSKGKEVAQNIICLMAPLQDRLNLKQIEWLITFIEDILCESVLGNNEDNYKLFIALTYKTRDMKRVLVAANNMAGVFPTVYPLEWVARIFVENNLPWNPTSDLSVSWEECETQVNMLLKLYSSSLWGNLAKGLNYLSRDEIQLAIPRFIAACECSLEQFSNSAGQPIIWWRLLLETQCNQKHWSALETTLTKVIQLLQQGSVQWPFGSDEHVTQEELILKFLLQKAEAFMNLGHRQHYLSALEILKPLGESADILVIKCLLHVDLEEAHTKLQLNSSRLDVSQYNLLYSQLLFEQGKFQQAKELLVSSLNENSENVDFLISLGRVYQSLGEFAQSLPYLLKAAKLDSTREKPFLYLGHYYRKIGDGIKACKCYEKCHALAPTGEEEGAALSDIYRELGMHDKNFVLLHAATLDASSGNAWAWFRLGLHYQAQHEAQKTISALQRCLQLQHRHVPALESLGDAYLSRGSFVAAQKVHERVIMLDPSAVYPRCQIAKIQLCIGEPLTAIKQYEAILDLCTNASFQTVALVGKAQAHLVLAVSYASKNHFENALNHSMSAMVSLDLAAELKPKSVTVWKCLGDACCLLRKLPEDLIQNGILLPTRFLKLTCGLDASASLTLKEILSLGSKFYSAALQLTPSDSSLWHDLGLSYYFSAQEIFSVRSKVNTELEVHTLEQRAINCLKKCLHLNPNSSEALNSLGIVLTESSTPDMALAQHCFIQSILFKPSALNWTHLGSFYLINGEIQLAHQAFSQAQALDPRFVSCWTGQALVAESVQHYDAPDLFRHCCTLGVHPESSLGLGHFFMLALSDNEIQPSSVATLAADAMTFYTLQFSSDCIGLNLAGLCLEEQGLMNSSSLLYKNALSFEDSTESSDHSVFDCIRVNLSRSLLNQNHPEDAIAVLSNIIEPNFQSECLFALAFLKKGEHENGYNKYMSALHWLAQNQHHKANILVALACLQYKFSKIHEAKTLLFESCKEGGGCAAGIIALGALGFIEGDDTLISAALNELQSYKNENEVAHHIAFLTMAHALVKSSIKEARNILSRAVLRRPHCPHLWRMFSWYLLVHASSTSYNKQKLCRSIVQCASSATVLSQLSSKVKDSSAKIAASAGCQHFMEGMFRVHGYIIGEQYAKALKEAERGLLMRPYDPYAWSSFVHAWSAAKPSAANSKIAEVSSVWSKQSKPRLRRWFQNAVRLSADQSKCAKFPV